MLGSYEIIAYVFVPFRFFCSFFHFGLIIIIIIV